MVYQYQPVNPLNAFAQSFQLVRGIQDDNARRQQEQIAQQQAMQRQRDLQGAIANLRMNPSPEAIAEFGLQFPEAKDQIEGYFKTIGEAKQNTQRQAMSEVIIAQRSGRLNQIPVILERFAAAADNANDPAMAQEFRDAAEFAKANPEAAAETAKLRFGMVDPEGYKTLFANTAAIQNYEYFKGILGPDKVEEIIGVTPKDGVQVLPNGMVIAGPDSPLAKSMSGGMGSQLPTVSTKEQLDALPAGAEFIGPDGVRRVKNGGGGSNATGNFR